MLNGLSPYLINATHLYIAMPKTSTYSYLSQGLLLLFQNKEQNTQTRVRPMVIKMLELCVKLLKEGQNLEYGPSLSKPYYSGQFAWDCAEP